MADQEPVFKLIVIVRQYGPGTPAGAAAALKAYQGTFDADAGEVEILNVQPAPGMSPDSSRWHGWQLMLNCGHSELTDCEDRQVGQLVTCDMCPLTAHSPEAPGRPVRQMRVVTGRQAVEAPGEPGSVEPAYWYGT